MHPVLRRKSAEPQVQQRQTELCQTPMHLSKGLFLAPGSILPRVQHEHVPLPGHSKPNPASPRNVRAFGWIGALSTAAPGGGRAKRVLAATGLAEEPSVLGGHDLPTRPRALQGYRGCGERGEEVSAREGQALSPPPRNRHLDRPRLAMGLPGLKENPKIRAAPHTIL